MAIPKHVFSRQDDLFLCDDNNKNLKEIERFRREDVKLDLCLEKSFKEDNLLALGEAFSLLLDRWKLQNFW